MSGADARGLAPGQGAGFMSQGLRAANRVVDQIGGRYAPESIGAVGSGAMRMLGFADRLLIPRMASQFHFSQRSTGGASKMGLELPSWVFPFPWYADDLASVDLARRSLAMRSAMRPGQQVIPGRPQQQPGAEPFSAQSGYPQAEQSEFAAPSPFAFTWLSMDGGGGSAAGQSARGFDGSSNFAARVAQPFVTSSGGQSPQQSSSGQSFQPQRGPAGFGGIALRSGWDPAPLATVVLSHAASIAAGIGGGVVGRTRGPLALDDGGVVSAQTAERAQVGNSWVSETAIGATLLSRPEEAVRAAAIRGAQIPMTLIAPVEPASAASAQATPQSARVRAAAQTAQLMAALPTTASHYTQYSAPSPAPFSSPSATLGEGTVEQPAAPAFTSPISRAADAQQSASPIGMVSGIAPSLFDLAQALSVPANPAASIAPSAAARAQFNAAGLAFPVLSGGEFASPAQGSAASSSPGARSNPAAPPLGLLRTAAEMPVLAANWDGGPRLAETSRPAAPAPLQQHFAPAIGLFSSLVGSSVGSFVDQTMALSATVSAQSSAMAARFFAATESSPLAAASSPQRGQLGRPNDVSLVPLSLPNAEGGAERPVSSSPATAARATQGVATVAVSEDRPLVAAVATAGAEQTTQSLPVTQNQQWAALSQQLPPSPLEVFGYGGTAPAFYEARTAPAETAAPLYLQSLRHVDWADSRLTVPTREIAGAADGAPSAGYAGSSSAMASLEQLVAQRLATYSTAGSIALDPVFAGATAAAGVQSPELGGADRQLAPSPMAQKSAAAFGDMNTWVTAAPEPAQASSRSIERSNPIVQSLAAFTAAARSSASETISPSYQSAYAPHSASSSLGVEVALAQGPAPTLIQSIAPAWADAPLVSSTAGVLALRDALPQSVTNAGAWSVGNQEWVASLESAAVARKFAPPAVASEESRARAVAVPEMVALTAAPETPRAERAATAAASRTPDRAAPRLEAAQIAALSAALPAGVVAGSAAEQIAQIEHLVAIGAISATEVAAVINAQSAQTQAAATSSATLQTSAVGSERATAQQAAAQTVSAATSWARPGALGAQMEWSARQTTARSGDLSFDFIDPALLASARSLGLSPNEIVYAMRMASVSPSSLKTPDFALSLLTASDEVTASAQSRSPQRAADSRALALRAAEIPPGVPPSMLPGLLESAPSVYAAGAEPTNEAAQGWSTPNFTFTDEGEIAPRAYAGFGQSPWAMPMVLPQFAVEGQRVASSAAVAERRVDVQGFDAAYVAPVAQGAIEAAWPAQLASRSVRGSTLWPQGADASTRVSSGAMARDFATLPAEARSWLGFTAALSLGLSAPPQSDVAAAPVGTPMGAQVGAGHRAALSSPEMLALSGAGAAESRAERAGQPVHLQLPTAGGVVANTPGESSRSADVRAFMGDLSPSVSLPEVERGAATEFSPQNRTMLSGGGRVEGGTRRERIAAAYSLTGALPDSTSEARGFGEAGERSFVGGGGHARAEAAPALPEPLRSAQPSREEIVRAVTGALSSQVPSWLQEAAARQSGSHSGADQVTLLDLALVQTAAPAGIPIAAKDVNEAPATTSAQSAAPGRGSKRGEDLEETARKVYDEIKRLLEIEKERGGGF